MDDPVNQKQKEGLSFKKSLRIFYEDEKDLHRNDSKSRAQRKPPVSMDFVFTHVAFQVAFSGS